MKLHMNFTKNVSAMTLHRDQSLAPCPINLSFETDPYFFLTERNTMTMFPLCLGIYIPVSLDCICESACVTFYNFSKLELTSNTAMWVVMVTHNCKLSASEAEAGTSQVINKPRVMW